MNQHIVYLRKGSRELYSNEPILEYSFHSNSIQPCILLLYSVYPLLMSPYILMYTVTVHPYTRCYNEPVYSNEPIFMPQL